MGVLSSKEGATPSFDLARLFSSQASSPSIAESYSRRPPPPHIPPISKTLISNMLLIDWKTYLAARKDKTAGNKDTSVFAKAWSPEKSTVSRTQEAPCSIPRRNKYWNIGRKSVADDAAPPPPPHHRRRSSLARMEKVGVQFTVLPRSGLPSPRARRAAERARRRCCN